MVNVKKILVVDDEEVIRTLYEYVFTQKGYTVRCAASGEEALEILETDSYQVMFLDLNMPGMNGLELCRKIKDLSPMFITYAVTGYVSLFEVLSCREAGFDDYFTKPVDMKLLCDVADSAFEKIERWTKRTANV